MSRKSALALGFSIGAALLALTVATTSEPHTKTCAELTGADHTYYCTGTYR